MPIGNTTRVGRWIALLALAAVPVASHGADFVPEVKLRAGYGLTDQDRLRRGSMGIGLGFTTPCASGRIAAEVGFFQKSGDAFLEPLGAAPAGKQALDPMNSGDQRRNSVSGLNLRLSWQAPLDDTGWDWAAGAMLGGTTFKHEYLGDVRSLNWKNTDPTSWRDIYYAQPRQSGPGVSPFASLSTPVMEGGSVEFTLLLLSYRSLRYQHVPGGGSSYTTPNDATGKPVGPIAPANDFPMDGLEKRNRFVPTFEVAYVFRF